ncbi:hypothetical protein EW145_g8446, partial [Phellinidium pouzarii]
MQLEDNDNSAKCSDEERQEIDADPDANEQTEESSTSDSSSLQGIVKRKRTATITSQMTAEDSLELVRTPRKNAKNSHSHFVFETPSTISFTGSPVIAKDMPPNTVSDRQIAKVVKIKDGTLSSLDPKSKTRAQIACKIFRASIAVENGFPTSDEKDDMIYSAFCTSASSGISSHEDELLKRWTSDEQYKHTMSKIASAVSVFQNAQTDTSSDWTKHLKLASLVKMLVEKGIFAYGGIQLQPFSYD